ncbi:MAG: DNA primase [Desulfatiglandales bacterium]
MDIREEIKSRLDIVEVVGQFVALRPQGKNYVGLCPFHQEKTPSFSVNPEGQFFHCFGCKAGGDIISFWMRYHELSFEDAVEDICFRYQIPLPTRKSLGSSQIRAILEVNHMATEYFRKALSHKRIGEVARAYLRKRGLKEEVIEEFGLGYAPKGWDFLTNYLRRKGALEEGIRSGLIGIKGDSAYDRFRNRIMFPLWGLRGEVTGFGGRILEDKEKEPKYLNTQESSAFQKRKYLYGLHRARDYIKAAQSALFVEGYMDLLTLHSFNLKNSVATLGTSISDDHLKAIRAYAREIVLLFDGDTAGRAAMLRVLPSLLNAEMNPKVVLLPQGHDPDTFLRERGYTEFVELLRDAKDAIQFYIHSVKTTCLEREAQIKAIRTLLKVLRGISSPLLIYECLRKISEYLGVSFEILLAEMDNLKDHRAETNNSFNLDEVIHGVCTKDTEALNLFYYNPNILNQISSEELKNLCLSDNALSLLHKMKMVIEKKQELDLDYLFDLCSEKESCILREVMLSNPIFENQDESVILDLLKNRITVNTISEQIRKAKEKGDLNMINALLKQRAELLERFSQIA